MARAAKPTQPSWLEWLCAGLGLVLILAVVGVLAIKAVKGGGTPAEVAVRAGEVRAVTGGWRVTVEAENTGEQTAAQVEIEGRTASDTAHAVIDYVPGHGRREAVLVFRDQPDGLSVRVLGWTEP